MTRSLRLFRALAMVCLVGLAGVAGTCGAAELLAPGFRPLPLGVHALVGAKVFIKPDQVLDPGTIVIRDGFIQEAGKDVTPPADARVWDMKGKTVYAGFIDAYLVLGATNPPVSNSSSEPVDLSFTSPGVKFFGAPGVQTDMGQRGPGYDIVKVTPQFRAVEQYSPDEKILVPMREAGFTAAVVAPARGIVRGTSALLALSSDDPNRAVIKPDVFQHVVFETHQPGESAYPGSLMGVIAAVRQSFFDAHHYELDHADFAQHPEGRERPPFDPALEALAPAAAKKLRVAFEPGSALMDDRAARVARELGLDFCLVACGQEWRRPDLARATGATFIVPVDFPELPKMPDDDDWEQVSLDQLRAWDWAAENPALLRKQGLEVALTTYGLSDKKKFPSNLRLALDRGLSETDAVAGLTTVPAKLTGTERWLGTIEAGKLANLTVVEGGSYFLPEAKVRQVWIHGRVYDLPTEEPKESKTSAVQPAKASTETPEPGAKPKEEPERQPKPPEIAAGQTNRQSVATAPATPPEKADADRQKEKKKEETRDLRKQRVARSPMDGRGPLATPPAVLVRGATIWTCGPEGRLEDADLLVMDGKIKAVGKGLSVPAQAAEQALVIDGHGVQVTPGLIDCHSHTAILGSVNEASLPSTAMVRIHDVVNSETPNLYEQLAGGVTAVNLLHGSANPIGGQNCVIKLRDGAGPEELVFTDAPPGIKFALGENVKQSNWGERFVTRFPQTRMGVRTFIANRFTAAREYVEQLRAPPRVPPRRDLELEALGEILEGKRWIHCHCYRQDEILMLLRLTENFGIKIGTLQHVLEGYKVADEIAAAGVGASTFADWWAYKFEVYDAIAYNGSLMHDRGVVVSFNSDSSELARHLYTEAAKAVKYGGTPELEALKFVTLNPAKQLRIDGRVGSLEPGKDGDFVVWSKSPLDSGTVCLQTWIEGKKYFDRAADGERTRRLEKERDDLLAKARRLAKGGETGAESGHSAAGEARFFRVSLEHEYDHQERHCLDEP